MEKGPTPQKQKEGVGTPSFRNFTSVNADYNGGGETTVKPARAAKKEATVSSGFGWIHLEPLTGFEPVTC